MLELESSMIFEKLLGEIKSVTKGGDLLLDVGCGQGEYLELLEKTGIKCFGVDPLREVSIVPGANRMKSAGVEVFMIQASGEHLPFLDRMFDTVLCLSTLQHVANQRKVLGEIARVLKANGNLICSVPTYKNANSAFRWKKAPQYVTKAYDYDSFILEIETAGFKIGRVVGLEMYPPAGYEALQRISSILSEGSMQRLMRMIFQLGDKMPKAANSALVLANLHS